MSSYFAGGSPAAAHHSDGTLLWWEQQQCAIDTSAGAASHQRGPRTGPGSEVAAALLLALDGLEQRLEVALAEAQRPVPLDQLEEHGRAVAHRRGEDLQQVAVLVPVHQDAARP